VPRAGRGAAKACHSRLQGRLHPPGAPRELSRLVETQHAASSYKTFHTREKTQQCCVSTANSARLLRDLSFSGVRPTSVSSL
jgi:hypothetical protein